MDIRIYFIITHIYFIIRGDWHVRNIIVAVRWRTVGKVVYNDQLRAIFSWQFKVHREKFASGFSYL